MFLGGWGASFAEGGDTGSFVFDTFGQWIGILHASNDSQGSFNSASYMTPAKDVVKHIWEVTGCIASLP